MEPLPDDKPLLVLAYTLDKITPPGHSARLDAAIAIATVEPRLDAAAVKDCKARAAKCIEIARQAPGVRWREFIAVSNEAVSLQPPDSDLMELLFEDHWERQFFIDEWITLDEPTHSMPWELDEQRADLGAVLVRREESEFFDPFAEPQIRHELLFVPASEIEARLEEAYAWVKETAARDIHPMLLRYTLDGKGDFAALEALPLPWLRDTVGPGDRFRYDGTMYPWPWPGTPCSAKGEFEIVSHCEDVDGQYWFETRNLRTGESLFVSETLLMTATFPHTVRSNDRSCLAF